MHLICKQDEPSDFAISIGRRRSVRDAVRGLRRAEAELGWKPTVEFADLMRMMVEPDLNQAFRERDYVDVFAVASW